MLKLFTCQGTDKLFNFLGVSMRNFVWSDILEILGGDRGNHVKHTMYLLTSMGRFLKT